MCRIEDWHWFIDKLYVPLVGCRGWLISLIYIYSRKHLLPSSQILYLLLLSISVVKETPLAHSSFPSISWVFSGIIYDGEVFLSPPSNSLIPGILVWVWLNPELIVHRNKDIHICYVILSVFVSTNEIKWILRNV